MTSSQLKVRVLKAKESLPKHGITSLFFFKFKAEFSESKRNKERLTNVLQTRTSDEGITKKLEELVEILKK